MIKFNSLFTQIFILYILIIPFNSKAQENLVLNPSFEDFNPDEELSCVAYTSEKFSKTIMYWKSPSIGSPDIISMDVDPNCTTHALNTILTNQLPRTGKAYTGMINRDSENEIHREYIQGTLSSNLEVGVNYKIKFYISLGAASGRTTNNIGIKFFNSEQSFQTTSFINIVPDANYDGLPLVNKDDWTEIAFEFTPTDSNLRYFVIGNFFDSENTDFELIEGGLITDFYYYLVDDVSISKSLTPIFDEMGPYCEGTEFTLPTTSLNNIEGTWTPEINNKQTTTYTFIPNDDTYPTTQITIEIIPEFDFVINQFCKNHFAWLSVTGNSLINIDNSKIVWEINGVNYENKELNINDYSSISGIVTVTNENGCSKTKEFNITLNPDQCTIPKGISPNGDGLNDYLDLTNLDVENITIFNRFGAIVFNKKDYKNEWHGQSNSGNILPSGVYFYNIVTYKNETFTGWIQLIRETEK